MAQIFTANRLRDGAVVFLANDGGWVEQVGEARALKTAEEIEAAKSLAEAAEANRIVVALDLIDLAEAAEPTPARLRERIRALGPTVRPDLARSQSPKA